MKLHSERSQYSQQKGQKLNHLVFTLAVVA